MGKEGVMSNFLLAYLAVVMLLLASGVMAIESSSASYKVNAGIVSISAEAGGAQYNAIMSSSPESISASSAGYKLTLNLPAPLSCGDSVCSSTESCESCSTDCGVCASGSSSGSSSGGSSSGSSSSSSGGGGGGGGGGKASSGRLIDITLPAVFELPKQDKVSYILKDEKQVLSIVDIKKDKATISISPFQFKIRYPATATVPYGTEEIIDTRTTGVPDLRAAVTYINPGKLKLALSELDTCSDNIRNYGEEFTDCGGPCRPCPEPEAAKGPEPAENQAIEEDTPAEEEPVIPEKKSAMPVDEPRKPSKKILYSSVVGSIVVLLFTAYFGVMHFRKKGIGNANP